MVRLGSRVQIPMSAPNTDGHGPAPHQNLSGVVGNRIMEPQVFGAEVQIPMSAPNNPCLSSSHLLFFCEQPEKVIFYG